MLYNRIIPRQPTESFHMKKCKTCNSDIVSNNKKKQYCDIKCKNKHSNNVHQNYISQQERGVKRKLMLVELLGGKCQKCDYRKNLAGLCFHHKDKSTKVFGIDTRACFNKSIKKLKEEALKCTLLCHNCHMEEHYPHLSLFT